MHLVDTYTRINHLKSKENMKQHRINMLSYDQNTSYAGCILRHANLIIYFSIFPWWVDHQFFFAGKPSKNLNLFCLHFVGLIPEIGLQFWSGLKYDMYT
jgi:hypothetical protein